MRIKRGLQLKENQLNPSFDRFIYAQGINDVGLATSKSLSENFSSLLSPVFK